MDTIRELLADKSTVTIRKGAKQLIKHPSPDYETVLYEALVRELGRNKTWDPPLKSWETLCELVKAAGVCNYKSITPLIEPFIERNEEHDMVTHICGLTYLRLQRLNLHDITPLKQRMHTMKHSVAFGMFAALSQDKMILSNEDALLLVNFFWDFGWDTEEGYSDPRCVLASACAGWDRDTVKPFLKHCTESWDERLKNIAENALKGKYSNPFL